MGDRRAAEAAVEARPRKALRHRRRAALPAVTGVEIDVDDPAMQAVLDRSLADLVLLGEDEPGSSERLVAAGLPWYAALYGRDSLLTAYEAIAFRPDLATDALTILASHQALAGDRHGGEPGQILHELRTGEMARCGEVPFGPSFGSVDATPLWLVLLGEANDWLGDPALLDRLWPAALRALGWLDARLRLDEGRFLRYVGRPGALANEGWKDSPDAVRDRSGATVPAPIALAEVQGYRLRRLAADGQAGTAARRAASRRSPGPPRGPAAAPVPRLRSGLPIEASRRWPSAATTASPMRSPRMSANACGRGSSTRPWPRPSPGGSSRRTWIRAGGSGRWRHSEPAFDPLGYHTGSVWPHDTALIAGGLKRAGFDAAAIHVADELLEAALALPASRLPELLSGEARDPSAARRGASTAPARCRPGRRPRRSTCSGSCSVSSRTHAALAWSCAGHGCPAPSIGSGSAASRSVPGAWTWRSAAVEPAFGPGAWAAIRRSAWPGSTDRRRFAAIATANCTGTVGRAVARRGSGYHRPKATSRE